MHMNIVCAMYIKTYLQSYSRIATSYFKGPQIKIQNLMACNWSGTYRTQHDLFHKTWMTSAEVSSYGPGSKLLILGMVIPPLMTGILLMSIYSPTIRLMSLSLS